MDSGATPTIPLSYQRNPKDLRGNPSSIMEPLTSYLGP